MRVQWPPHIHLLTALRTTLYHLKVTGNSPSLLVVQAADLLVAHPGVCTSATGVNPHDVLEAKVVSQRRVDDLDRHGHECPALVADVGLVAAGTNVVVVRQVDIEAQLLGEGLEGGRVAERLAVARVGGVDGADFETRRHEAEDIFAQASRGKH